MKKNIIIALTALLGLFFTPVQAKHIIGGVITYECMGPGSVAGTQSYRITMKIYRDCDEAAGGAQFDNPAYISIFRGTEDANSMFTNLVLNSLSVDPIPVDTPPCIQNVPYVCVQEGVYTFTVNLPVSATDSYFIVYQRCCRNNSILNIYDPESAGATYSVEITPEAQQLCNNSPVYNYFPEVVICKDAPLLVDHSATDAEGDVLTYRFCAPELGGGDILTNPGYTSCFGAQPIPPCAPPFDPVPFIQPTYSALNPMGGNPQININAFTGLITGIPNIVGRFVVGVCVDEYRNGVKLSTIKRDFQFNVADCDPTVLALLNGGDTLVLTPQGYYLRSCGANDLYIENLSLDPNFITDFRWSFDLGGATYFNNTEWSPTVPFPGPGQYKGSLVLNPLDMCADTAEITVDIFPGVTADFSYAYDTCVAGPVQFTDLTLAPSGIAGWSWRFGVPGGMSTEGNPAYTYPVPGVHTVRLNVTDGDGCRDVAVKEVRYLPAPAYIIVRPSSFLGCVPGEITFENLSVPIDSTYHIVWDFGDGAMISDVISPSHVYDSAGVFTVSVAITSPIGCYVADTFPDLIRVLPSPIADFTYSPNEVTNLSPTVSFENLSVGADRYFWQLDRFATSNEENPVFSFPDTGLMRVLLVVTHPQGCKDSVSQYIDVKPEIRWFMPNAFTPNGDPNNEGFLGKGFIQGMTNFKMTIWNRWGELVFESTDPYEAWNGRARQTGGPSPAGVYVYRVTFDGPRKTTFEYKGFATLIR